MTFEELGINTNGRKYGTIKVICPKCNPTRSNKGDKSLSVDLDKGLYNCHHCDFKGSIYTKPYKVYTKPEWKNNTELSVPLVKWFEGRGINQSTLIKMKITEGLEFMPQEGKEMNTIQFNYFHNGELLNVKYRTGNKRFKLVKDAELIPYNIDAIFGEKECIICEGEIDCLTYIQCGYENTISVPNGAGSNLEYLDRFIETHFEDKQTIYLATDTDKKGLELRAELIRRLGAEKCKIITYGDGCKDANELMMKIGAGFEAVRASVTNSKDVKVSGIFEVEDLQDELNSLYLDGLKRGDVIGLPCFDQFISWVTGRVCIVTGIPSHGKSELLDEIIYRLNLNVRWKVAYFSPENHPKQWHIAKIISKITGKSFSKQYLSQEEYEQAREYMKDNYFFIDPEDSSDLDDILDRAKFLVKRKGIKMLVIDPYNKLEHNIENGLNETQYISKFLDRLTTFAKQNDVLLFLVAHPYKMKKENGKFEVPNLYSISGSAHFYNKADYGLSVYRNDEAGNVEVHIQKVKFKHLGNTGVALLQYNLVNGRYIEFTGGQPDWDSNNHLNIKLFNDSMNENNIQPNLEFDDNDLPV